MGKRVRARDSKHVLRSGAARGGRNACCGRRVGRHEGAAWDRGGSLYADLRWPKACPGEEWPSRSEQLLARKGRSALS